MFVVGICVIYLERKKIVALLKHFTTEKDES